MICNIIRFYGDELLAPHPNPKLEDHPYSAVRDCLFNIFAATLHICGPGSVVGIATGYGLDGPGIKTQWGRDFPHLSRPALGPTQPPVQ